MPLPGHFFSTPVRIPAPLCFHLTWRDHSNSLHLCYLLTFPSSSDVSGSCLLTPSPAITFNNFTGDVNNLLASQFLHRMNSSERLLHKFPLATLDNANPSNCSSSEGRSFSILIILYFDPTRSFSILIIVFFNSKNAI